jgi:hypothetical protein
MYINRLAQSIDARKTVNNDSLMYRRADLKRSIVCIEVTISEKKNNKTNLA